MDPRIPDTRKLTGDELYYVGAWAHPPRKRKPDCCRRRVQFVLGCVFIAFALVAAIHVAAAAPGKIARTGSLYHQIEGLR